MRSKGVEIQETDVSLRLDGRGFVLIGAGPGIGLATARTLTALGGEVLCADISEADARRVADDVGGHAMVADATNREAVKAIFDRAEAVFSSRLTGVVDIVGASRTQPLTDFTDREFDHEISIVVRHAYYALQIGGPMLARNGGGSIVLIGSQAGDRVFGEVPVYGMAKSALHHLTRYAANEFGPLGVRVNAIAPGVVATPHLLSVLPESQLQRMVSNNPMRRACVPQDVAKMIAFLSSGMASYVNGAVLPLDGGASNLLAVADMKVELKVDTLNQH